MNSRRAAARRARPILTNPYEERRSGNVFVRLLVGLFFVAAVVALAGFGYLYWGIHQAASGSTKTFTFHVNKGDTVTTVADRLKADGVISSTLLFHIDARLRGLGGKLLAGDYPLRPSMTIDQTISALTVYHARTVRVTIPEGYRIEQIASTLSAHGISSTQFMREAEHPSRLSVSILAGKPASASLEGYLFPSTYDVPPHYSGSAFARYMVETLDQKFTPAMRTLAHHEGFSVYQVLTLASIVEREAKVNSERPIIASVYLNRLHIGMPLQADPTVQYVVGTSNDWWPLLSTAQLQTPGAYNTYVNKGLPPGPIANPGLASIQAVLHPKSTKFLYFVAKGGGRHAFATTYQQQLANEAKYANASP